MRMAAVCSYHEPSYMFIFRRIWNIGIFFNIHCKFRLALHQYVILL
jgi:hypothetical protein